MRLARASATSSARRLGPMLVGFESIGGARCAHCDAGGSALIGDADAALS